MLIKATLADVLAELAATTSNGAGGRRAGWQSWPGGTR